MGCRLGEGRALDAAAVASFPPPGLRRPRGSFRHGRRLPPAPLLAPGPASDSAPPPPVPSSPGRRRGPLPRHEEAVGEEAFPGEGSGGGRRREGAGKAGRPEGGRVTAAGPRGRGRWDRARPTQRPRAAARRAVGGSPACGPRAPAPPRAEGLQPPQLPAIPETPREGPRRSSA